MVEVEVEVSPVLQVLILGSMDGDRDAAVLAVPVDYSKAHSDASSTRFHT